MVLLACASMLLACFPDGSCVQLLARGLRIRLSFQAEFVDIITLRGGICSSSSDEAY